MHWLDIVVFIVYMLAMVGVGLFFFNKNESDEDYYLGGRQMSSYHVGLSVVATDVGGGFSIGLGGLGYVMGVSGSWMLFTGLIGAWLAAVLLIPRLYRMPGFKNFLTFPQVLNDVYGAKVALAAGVISGVGYLGFTASQILAGAKLASVTFDWLSINNAILLLGCIAVGYTVMGGIKAVIYTDTVQWMILIIGLAFVGLPLAYHTVGGWSAIQESVQPEMLSLGNIDAITIINWAVTIIPIWFVGMTLYQRIFACKTEKDAKKAWFIAGLLEWPLMAFMGVGLGLLSRVAFDQDLFSAFDPNLKSIPDPETGLPLLIKYMYPAGLMGLMISAYFSAIMSTADSCLMAASGNFVSDIIMVFKKKKSADESSIKLSQYVTFALGALAIILALSMENVLDLMLMSYAFMVSGLLVPVLGALFLKKPNPTAALVATVLGGATTLSLQIGGWDLPLGLDPNIFGISAAVLSFLIVSLFNKPTGEILEIKEV